MNLHDKKEREAFIRKTLEFDYSVKTSLRNSEIKDHIRFDMTGYDIPSKNFFNAVHTNYILSLFAGIGIFDYTDFLYLDFYKGNPTLYLRHWSENETIEVDLSGYGTVEIIDTIIEMTVLSGKYKRRREH